MKMEYRNPQKNTEIMKILVMNLTSSSYVMVSLNITFLPSRHLLAQKHHSNLGSLFKVNNKDTRTTSGDFEQIPHSFLVFPL